MIIELFNKLYNLPLQSAELFNSRFMAKGPSKKSGYVVTGTIVLCESNYFFAFYDHRSDMTASGETEEECLKHLREMYEFVLKAEEEGEIEKPKENVPVQLPDDWNIKKFTDSVSLI